ncbi:MAG: hypothetical protein M3Z54_02720 [Gemmatimonadota bacterium]|nr:hypothetical protein [Gemmatimonadota bacterium]
MDIAILRDEYSRVGVGRALQRLLGRIVLSTVQLYPPAEYSPDGTWESAACEDVLNDWVFERLLTRGDLAVMLGSTETVQQLRAACTTSLRQFLTNRRRRSIASNLYKRIRDMLVTDKVFIVVQPSMNPADTTWTVADAPAAELSGLSPRELMRVANRLSDEDLQVVHYGPFSQKLSPILRKPRLKLFLTHLLKNSEGALPISAILDVFRFRFMLVDATEQSLTDDVPDEYSDPTDAVSNHIAAESVVMRLNSHEVHVIREYFRQEGHVRQTSHDVGIAEDGISATVRRVFEMITELAESADEAHAIRRELEVLVSDGAK